MAKLDIEADLKKIPKHDVIGIVIAIVGVIGIYLVYKYLAGNSSNSSVTPQVSTPVTDSGTTATTASTPTAGTGVQTTSNESSTVSTPTVVTLKTLVPGAFGLEGQPLYAETQQVVLPTVTTTQTFAGSSSADSGSLSTLALTQGSFAQRSAQESQNLANEASILGHST